MAIFRLTSLACVLCGLVASNPVASASALHPSGSWRERSDDRKEHLSVPEGAGSLFLRSTDRSGRALGSSGSLRVQKQTEGRRRRETRRMTNTTPQEGPVQALPGDHLTVGVGLDGDPIPKANPNSSNFDEDYPHDGQEGIAYEHAGGSDYRGVSGTSDQAEAEGEKKDLAKTEKEEEGEDKEEKEEEDAETLEDEGEGGISDPNDPDFYRDWAWEDMHVPKGPKRKPDPAGSYDEDRLSGLRGFGIGKFRDHWTDAHPFLPVCHAVFQYADEDKSRTVNENEVSDALGMLCAKRVPAVQKVDEAEAAHKKKSWVFSCPDLAGMRESLSVEGGASEDAFCDALGQHPGFQHVLLESKRFGFDGCAGKFDAIRDKCSLSFDWWRRWIFDDVTEGAAYTQGEVLFKELEKDAILPENTTYPLEAIEAINRTDTDANGDVAIAPFCSDFAGLVVGVCERIAFPSESDKKKLQKQLDAAPVVTGGEEPTPEPPVEIDAKDPIVRAWQTCRAAVRDQEKFNSCVTDEKQEEAYRRRYTAAVAASGDKGACEETGRLEVTKIVDDIKDCVMKATSDLQKKKIEKDCELLLDLLRTEAQEQGRAICAHLHDDFLPNHDGEGGGKGAEAGKAEVEAAVGKSAASPSAHLRQQHKQTSHRRRRKPRQRKAKRQGKHQHVLSNTHPASSLLSLSLEDDDLPRLYSSTQMATHKFDPALDPTASSGSPQVPTLSPAVSVPTTTTTTALPPTTTTTAPHAVPTTPAAHAVPTHAPPPPPPPATVSSPPSPAPEGPPPVQEERDAPFLLPSPVPAGPHTGVAGSSGKPPILKPAPQETEKEDEEEEEEEEEDEEEEVDEEDTLSPEDRDLAGDDTDGLDNKTGEPDEDEGGRTPPTPKSEYDPKKHGEGSTRDLTTDG
uniref:EF-hand domain-containing protein n=1 Tax=Chromera velia CCMP2878 TaxID=1169474 RepID=A0A0G4GTF9_9ALVE|mmetsp:Transcript_10398/g.20161  ORF Transcript_10398/g.20161 Transcript_10398/m.20161 type:complete len:905 (+) Transcript_10398:111-2825(+)|eukprot:Cvel_5187.t1-p1 / transcript=Cvel_5187.t1 / gene=Cvel_5187 / organism=Chromera_velia_CCMP2878 / gene_product=hypothetical protein / transcript_product=hypothetical protein / location=Cvel_scaffold238:62220-69412(+) / protein_length=904 / sequence_SO=supercontig / SO=protein_coding / is_pseudo=false